MPDTEIIKGGSLPNIPWEDKPEDVTDVVWRSKRNPVILRDAIPASNSIFNSAAVPFKDGVWGYFL
jgi:beta-1,4-mannooligosaccharide/beta-1,4-mannosyl-N-acetylglucosamine phosphorylase